jgi:hypothetical protein
VLPDFPAIKLAVQEAAARAVLQLVEKHPTVGGIQKIRLFEGQGTALQETNDKLASPLERISIPLSLDRKDVIEKGVAALSEQVPSMAARLLGAQLGMLVREVTRAADHTGNIVQGGGKPFNQDQYVSMLDTVELDFDASGAPSIPDLFHPDPTIQAGMQRALEKWMKDPAFMARVENSIEKQRQKWNDRESNRKLVD